MKKKVCLLAFLILAWSSFAEGIDNWAVYIQGTGNNRDHVELFIKIFTIEVIGAGYKIADNSNNADFIIQFITVPFQNRFLLNIGLIRASDNLTIITTEHIYYEPQDVLFYNRWLFFTIWAHIPPWENPALENLSDTAAEDESWRNKWVYLQASFNFPITFYALRNDGLIGGIGVYAGPFENPHRVMPLDNKINALPGFTLGAELQFLNWMSIGPNFQLSMGDLNASEYLTNITLGLQLKFPIKLIKNLMINPYAAGALMFSFSNKPVFTEPMYTAIGGGVQTGVKWGNRGAFFIDVNFLYYGNVKEYNPYGNLYPNPNEISYTRYVIGLGIGYKIGFLDRE